MISTTIKEKNMNIQINNTAFTKVTMDGSKIASSASGTLVNGEQSAAAAGAAAAGSFYEDGRTSTRPVLSPVTGKPKEIHLGTIPTQKDVTPNITLFRKIPATATAVANLAN